MDHPEGPDKNFKGETQHEAPEPDQYKKQMDQFEGKVGDMDHPKGPDQEIRRAPHHEAPKLDQSRKQKNQFEGDVHYMDSPEGPDQKFRGEPQLDQSKQQNNQLEGVVGYMDHPKSPNQKFKGPLTPKRGEPRKQKNEVEGEDEYIDHTEDPNEKFKGVPQHETSESDQSKKQMNQSDSEVDFMDDSKDPKQIFKDAPQYETTEPDQYEKEMNQSDSEVGFMDDSKDPNQIFKDAPQYEATEPDQSEKQIYQSDSEVGFMDDSKDPNQIFKDAPQSEATEPDQSEKQMNQSDSEVGFMDDSEDPNQIFKDAPQYEAKEPDQSEKQGEVDYMNSELKGAPLLETSNVDESEEQINQSEAKSIPKGAIKSADDEGKQSLQTTDKEVSLALGAQKVTTEEEDKNNVTGLERISTNIPEDSSSQLAATSQDQGKDEIAPKKKHFWSNWPVIGDAPKASVPKQPKTDPSKESDLTAASQATVAKQPEIDFPDEKQQEHIEVKVDEDDTEPAAEVVPSETTSVVTPSEPTVAASSKTLEILKSVVYGGLIESLTSLSVVTSAASADATTLNIVALSMANLIGGLFILGHNLEELKTEQVERYIELLGQKENFILHAFIAIISFLVFGLVPPVVYGFSFGESGDEDFKLAAVAAASLLCITMLSFAKAYIKRPNSYFTYFKTVLYYVSTGAVASLLSYIAGDLVKELLEKLGWFESASNFSLQIPGIGVQQPTWGSY